MENHHAMNGTTHYFNGHFPVRKLLIYQAGYLCDKQKVIFLSSEVGWSSKVERWAIKNTLVNWLL